MDIFYRLLGPAITLLICFGGGLIMFGRIKQKVDDNSKNIAVFNAQANVTKAECEKESKRCREALCNKISEVKDNVKEVKELVIDLHGKQAKRIEGLDAKREAAKDEYKDQLQKLNVLIARIDQRLQNGQTINT